MGDVLFRAGGVHHQIKMVALVNEHQVVQNAAPVIGEQTVALAPLFQAGDIGRDQRFQRKRDIRPAQDHLPHMADIKQAAG